MKLNEPPAGGPDPLLQYSKRHEGDDPVYLPLHTQLKKAGVHNYSIHYHAPTRLLFAFAEVDDEQSFARVAATKECRAWWKYMATGAQKYDDDGTPWSEDLQEVFFMA